MDVRMHAYNEARVLSVSSYGDNDFETDLAPSMIIILCCVGDRTNSNIPDLLDLYGNIAGLLRLTLGLLSYHS
jgi:hypothetical protein